MHNTINRTDPPFVVSDLVQLDDGREVLVRELREGNWVIVYCKDNKYECIKYSKIIKHVACLNKEETLRFVGLESLA